MRASLLALLLLLAACGDTDVSGPSATAGTSSASSVSSPASTSTPSSPFDSPSMSRSVEPTPEPDLQLPADAPTLVDDPAHIARVSAGDLRPLVPPQAEITFTTLQTTPQDPIDQVALAWRRGADAFASTHGFVVWQRSEGPAWRALYAFTDRPRSGVLGITMEPGDLTNDGIADLLTSEHTGGTGACGRWRVVTSLPGNAAEIYRKEACDTQIAIAGGDLRIREAVYEPGDPHCCPSAFRVTTLRWNGEDWVETGSKTQPVGAG
ncbi:MAG TPA: hypothetical protein VJ913_08050 [Actinomycetota bacterium]|nr:hypothetical protein [Actinomycetota bacterium]